MKRAIKITVCGFLAVGLLICFLISGYRVISNRAPVLHRLGIGEIQNRQVSAPFNYPRAEDCIFVVELNNRDYNQLRDTTGQLKLTFATNIVFASSIVISRTNEWSQDASAGTE